MELTQGFFHDEPVTCDLFKALYKMKCLGLIEEGFAMRMEDHFRNCQKCQRWVLDNSSFLFD